MRARVVNSSTCHSIMGSAANLLLWDRYDLDCSRLPRARPSGRRIKPMILTSPSSYEMNIGISPLHRVHFKPSRAGGGTLN